MDGADRADAAITAVASGCRARELEDATLEFKTDGRSADDTVRDLAEAVVCFANARGGTLIVGIADAVSGEGGIVGSQLDPTRTARRIFELTEPPLVVGCRTKRSFEHDLLVITVPQSADVHAVGGRSTERVGDSCQPMTPQRIASVLADRRNDDWSARDSTAPVAAADPLALAEIRAIIGEGPHDRRVSADATDTALVASLGLTTPAGTLNNAGALLLSETLHRGEELAYSFRRTPAGLLAANEHLRGPLIVTLRRVLAFIEARTDRTSVNLPGGQQLHIADLPDAAVRESIVNAVMHRDYRTELPVTIEHSPGRLVVISPGAFVTGVSAENILTVSSRTRNTQLSYAIRAMGLAESAGTGVDRMYAEMARVGHHPPTYDADLQQVAVTLQGGRPNTYVTRYAAGLPRDERSDADAMLVLLTLLSQRTLTAEQLAPIVQKPVADTEQVLERLATDTVRMLEPTRRSARWKYPLYRFQEHVVAALRPALTYRRRTADSVDRTLIDLVRESGEINARIVRITLGIDGPAASRTLADLVRRGILVKTSRAARGPGVTYGPGPTFAASAKKDAHRADERDT